MSKLLHVLLVTNCEDDVSLVVRQLRHGGYEPDYICVDTAESMHTALIHREWDIVLADYVLPQFSALAALEILHQTKLDIPFIVLSSSLNEQVAVMAMKAGAHDYVMKDNLARLAPVVTRELEEKNVRQERQQRKRHLELLNQITRAAASILDVDKMLNALVTYVRDLMEADGAFINLWDGRRGLPNTVAIQTAYPMEHIRPQVGEPTITEAVLQAGVPLVVNDVSRTPYLSRRLSQQLPFRALLGIPLLVGGQKLGAVVIAYNQPRRFFPEEIARAEQATGQIALAVAKANLLVAERTQRELAETLREVATALNSTLEREQVLALILDQLMRVVAYDSASIMLLQDDALQNVAHRSIHSYVQQSSSLMVNELRHVQTILVQQRPLIIADTAVDARWRQSPGTELIRSWLGVPMLIQDRIIGLLNLNKTTPQFYTEGDAQVAMTFAAQAAIAIENARLYAQQRAYTAQLEARVAARTQELEEANTQLQELDRLKSKFVSDVTHELRTPLTNLSLYLDLLEKGKEERRTRYMMLLREQIGRLNQLITDILDLSRLERHGHEAPFTAVDLNELVRQVVEIQQPRADEAKLALIYKPDKSIPLILGQYNQLLQVATNLIANAINYTPSGSVTVCTAWDAAASLVWLRIADTGMGIDPQEKKLLFDRFYRGERTQQLSVPGTGLGLAIVQEIIALHGGLIEVESEIDRGSTFHIGLPAMT